MTEEGDIPFIVALIGGALLVLALFIGGEVAAQ